MLSKNILAEKLRQISHEQLPYSPKFSIANVFILYANHSSDNSSDGCNGGNIALIILLVIAVIGLVISVVINVFLVVQPKRSRCVVTNIDTA